MPQCFSAFSLLLDSCAVLHGMLLLASDQKREMEDDQVIDIPLSQLTEWLTSRRHHTPTHAPFPHSNIRIIACFNGYIRKVPAQWQERLLAVREALSGALKQLPDVSEVTSVLSGRCKPALVRLCIAGK